MTLSHSISMAAAATGLSAQHLRDAIHRGDLKARRSSRTADGDPQGKWIVLTEDLDAYIKSLPEG